MRGDSSHFIKLFKFLQKYARISRRQAHREIVSGNVEVDEDVVRNPFLTIDSGQNVKWKGRLIKPSEEKFRYIVLNKPEGFICSTVGCRTIYDIVGEYGKGLAYVGRLDVRTSGTIIMTDDGSLANKLMRLPVSRIYCVRLSAPLDKSQCENLILGPSLDGRKVKLGNVRISGREVELEICEGKWREVRRIFSSIGADVVKLHRKSFAGISADGIPLGKWRELSSREVAHLKKLVKKLSEL